MVTFFTQLTSYSFAFFMQAFRLFRDTIDDIQQLKSYLYCNVVLYELPFGMGRSSKKAPQQTSSKPMVTTTIRLEEDTQKRLQNIADRIHITPSVVIRIAIEKFLEESDDTGEIRLLVRRPPTPEQIAKTKHEMQQGLGRFANGEDLTEEVNLAPIPRPEGGSMMKALQSAQKPKHAS